MAIGLGKLLGFDFLENFNYPYISKSVTEFWRRWHMSLSRWFRDYVYIPLGGSRRGLKRQIFNLLVVWALTGIWHGANWTFLLWGLYYAFFLIIEKVFLLRWLEKIPNFIGHIYALFVAVCGWVLFQLGNMEHVFTYYKAMFGFGSGGLISGTDIYYLSGYLLLIIIGAVASTPLGAKLYQKMPHKVKGVLSPILVALVLVISTAYLVDATYNPFLYFRF
jgi:alginate O-acetyltransferase complex protein AlgI